MISKRSCAVFSAVLMVVVSINLKVDASQSFDIVASHSTYVAKNASDVSQNDSEQLYAKDNGANSYSKIAYLRFKLSELSNAKNSGLIISNLVLSLHIKGIQESDTMYVYMLNDGHASETTWSTDLTWSTRPDGTGNLDVDTGLAATSSRLAAYNYSNAGNHNIVLNNDAISLLESDSNGEITLILCTDVAKTTTLASTSNSTGLLRPTLRVAYYPSRFKKVSIPVADNAFVKKNSADQDDSQQLIIKDNGVDGNSRIGYLRFDLSSIKRAVQFKGASLNFYLKSASGNDTIRCYAVNDGLQKETTWTANMAWSGRPDGTDTLVLQSGNANTSDLLGSVAHNSVVGVHSINLPDLHQLLTSDSNGHLSLVLCTDLTQMSYIAAKGNTSSLPVPTLTVVAEFNRQGTVILIH